MTPPTFNDALVEMARINDLLERLEKSRKMVVAHPSKLDEKVSVEGHEFTLREFLKAAHFRIFEKDWLNPDEMIMIDPTQIPYLNDSL